METHCYLVDDADQINHTAAINPVRIPVMALHENRDAAAALEGSTISSIDGSLVRGVGRLVGGETGERVGETVVLRQSLGGSKSTAVVLLYTKS
jgi:hypothetical protein